MAILISDKGDFRTMKITQDKNGHYSVIKPSIWRRHNDSKCVLTEQQRLKKHKVRTDKA